MQSLFNTKKHVFRIKTAVTTGNIWTDCKPFKRLWSKRCKQHLIRLNRKNIIFLIFISPFWIWLHVSLHRTEVGTQVKWFKSYQLPEINLTSTSVSKIFKFISSIIVIKKMSFFINSTFTAPKVLIIAHEKHNSTIKIFHLDFKWLFD